jgi:hypothetical protein
MDKALKIPNDQYRHWMRYRQTPVGQTEHRAEKMGVQK